MSKMIYYKLNNQPSVEMAMSYTEANLEIVKAEAYDGEYTIEDDGEEYFLEPNQLDLIEAQVTYTGLPLYLLVVRYSVPITIGGLNHSRMPFTIR